MLGILQGHLLYQQNEEEHRRRDTEDETNLDNKNAKDTSTGASMGMIIRHMEDVRPIKT